MPRIEYETKNFRNDTLAVIEKANEIVEQYQAQGFSLTLRQLYYQFVARGILANNERNYNKLGNIISDARRAGMLDWRAIEDRTRYLRRLSSWGKPQDILESAKNSYHRDLWANQDTRLEVWIEKDALVGVIEDVCQKYDVPFFSCRGYVSDSEMWRAGERVVDHNDKGQNVAHNDKGQNVVMLHLGDHDPSGIDMTRDIESRIQMFSGGGDFEVRRIALTMEQIKEINPPPNPAKITDSRYEGYLAKYGAESWELDALEPRYIVNLITDEILSERDVDKWKEAYNEQEAERRQIAEVIKKWDNLF